jgi:osmotically-inducible protein OsmY
MVEETLGHLRTDAPCRVTQAAFPVILKEMLTMKTDSQLQSDVMAELAWEPSIHSEEIGVEVKGGVVTLAGHVGTYSEKLEAERAAIRVVGVKAIAVEIDVRLPGINVRTDGDIARTVEHVLQWTTCLTNDSVKIKVEGGWVTLSGEVNWDYQRKAAVDGVRYLMGVKGVSDLIAIKPIVSAPLVKADIEAALLRRAHKDSNGISVRVDGNGVTLSGSVHSWSERELAAQTVWGTPGVRSVTNNTTITY